MGTPKTSTLRPTPPSRRSSSSLPSERSGRRLQGHSLFPILRNLVDAKVEAKKRLLLISTMAEILHQKSNTLEDKKLSAKLDKMNKDLNKIVRDF